MKNSLFKNIILVLIIGLLSLPLVQTIRPIAHPEPLSGAYTLPDTVSLNLPNWFSGSFQTKFNDFIEYKIGFRPWFVRVRNQIMYSLFDESTSYVELGKDGYLFTWGYYESYIGGDYLGFEKIETESKRLLALHNVLKKQNKHLLVIVAPNKARILNEFLPIKYDLNKVSRTNYEEYISQFEYNNINFIDFNAWFHTLKNSEYPLFPKTGIHWSTYGSIIAADSIIKYIENMSGIDYPNMSWSEIQLKDTVIDSENDLEKDLNLFTTLNKYKLAYPQLNHNDVPSNQKIPALIISDSFYWNFYSFDFPKSFLVPKSKFLFYNNTAYDEHQSAIPCSELDLKKHIEDSKFIILMATEANLPKFPYGFIDSFSNIYPIDEEIRIIDQALLQEKINKLMPSYIEKINKDTNWLAHIREKAKENNTSVESMVLADAKYMAQQEIEKNIFDKRVEELITRIKSDPNWYDSVKQKAKERNLSVEEMLKADAIYVLENEEK